VDHIRICQKHDTPYPTKGVCPACNRLHVEGGGITVEELLPMKKVQPRCLNCKFWEGDKVRTQNLINEYGYEMVMVTNGGFPGGGECSTSHLWAGLNISGDALCTLTVDANFGCVYWEEE